jgi:hypothetical protein
MANGRERTSRIRDKWCAWRSVARLSLRGAAHATAGRRPVHGARGVNPYPYRYTLPTSYLFSYIMG